MDYDRPKTKTSVTLELDAVEVQLRAAFFALSLAFSIECEDSFHNPLLATNNHVCREGAYLNFTIPFFADTDGDG